MQRLEALKTPDGQALPVQLKAEIARELQRLELVQKMIATLEVERDATMIDQASTHFNAS
jgi:transposase